MKKRTKILMAVLAIIIAILLVLAWFVGDYFVDYALASKGLDYDDPLSPTYEKSQDELENIAINDEMVLWLEEEIGCTEAYIETTDGLKLYTKEFLQEKTTNDWLIAVHGYTSSHKTVIDVAAEFYKQGYNVMVLDLRAHGLSEGEWITLGLYDGRDVATVAENIVAKNQDAEIILFGQSMGAATVMMASGEETLPENVKLVIEDCGYTDAYIMFSEQLDARFGLPSFPILDIASVVGKIQAGINLKGIRPIDAIAKSTLPMLFIHGLDDGFVLPYMVYELFDSYNGPKELLTVEGADHTASRNIERERYYETVFDFIEKWK